MDEKDNTREPDNRFAGADGHTTILSGISGASLSYLPGDIVDSAYQLTELLGRGGMGAVFACRHLVLGKNYALKLLSGEQLSDRAWSRFQVEAKSLAKLNHPGIVGIHNMGIDKEQCPYYVMDLLDGEALDAVIRRSGPLPVNAALDVFVQVADALASAHAQGIIHRDVKPSNLMLLQDEKTGVTKVKLVDFGIARLQKQGAATQSQTATGLIFGTPFYMSPEQCQGSTVDERTDIYSLGCALFEALTGAPPFVGDNAFHTLLLHQTEAPPSLDSRLSDHDFPQSLELAVKKMLQKDPGDRYQTMSQLKHDLERIKAGKPIMARGMTNTHLASIGTTDDAQKISLESSRSSRIRQAGLKDEIESEAVKEGGRSSLVRIVVRLCLLIAVPASAIVMWQKFNPSPKPSKTAPKQDETAAQDLLGDGNTSIDTQLAVLTKNVKDHGGAGANDFIFPKKELRKMGASEDEIGSVTVQELVELPEIVEKAKRRLKALEKDPQWLSAMYKRDGVFHFADDFICGAISIGNEAPVWARGDISALPNENACLYLFTMAQEAPEILHKFGPNDLTGIAIVFHSERAVNQAIDEISQWRRLKDFWLFDPLIKTIALDSEDWGESEFTETVLPHLEKLQDLSGLGLCYPVSGPAILKMPILHRLEALRLKRIENFEPLLTKLPDFDNLKEVFLMSQGTTDEQLKTLARMKNLRKLTVLRGQLTLASLETFKTMKALKELRIDRNDWTAGQRYKFQKNLPNCSVSYEKVIDRQFWPDVLPEPNISGKK